MKLIINVLDIVYILFRYYFYMITDRNYEYPERISKLQSLSNCLVNEYHLNFQNVYYPTIDQYIIQFERNNPRIKIQVYTCNVVNPNEKESIFSLHISQYKPNDYDNVINLLLLNKVGEGLIENLHYIVIKNLNAFFNCLLLTVNFKIHFVLLQNREKMH